MNTLDYILNKYKVNATSPSPITLGIGRFKDVPRLFNELGFKVGAEVGVFQGEYSRWLFRMMPGLKLYMIDLWEAYAGYKDFKKTTIKESYDIARKNVKGYDATLIKGWSDDKEILNKFEDESLDFVFIDGNHNYQWCVWDIANWSKKVKKGGIVYGHDYDDYSEKKQWNRMHVVDAVNGWCKSYRISPLFIIGRNRNKSWMYVKT